MGPPKPSARGVLGIPRSASMLSRDTEMLAECTLALAGNRHCAGSVAAPDPSGRDKMATQGRAEGPGEMMPALAPVEAGAA